MARSSEWIGKKYGYLTIERLSGKKKNEYILECLCDCGKRIQCPKNNLFRGKLKSCGCMKIQDSVVALEEAKKRIFSLITIENNCWLWKGGIRENGVCYITYFCKQMNPVKFFYELENGKVGVNWCFKRKCQTKTCVNPDHHILTNVSRLRQENNRKKNERKD